MEVASELIEAPAPLVVLPHPVLPIERALVFALFLPGETLGAYVERNRVHLPQGYFIVLHNGRPVPHALWAHLIPRTGDQIMIRAVAGGGGGRKVLATVAMIALSVVSAGAASAFGASLGSSLGFSTVAAAGSMSTAAIVGGALISGAIMIGGSLLINALLPPPKPFSQDSNKYTDSPTYAISGGSNRLRLWEPMLLIFGRNRVTPDAGATPYAEQSGDDQYLNQIFHFGLQAGFLALSDFRIGDTPLGNYDGVQTQISDASGTLSMFAGNVVSLEGAPLIAGTWLQRTTPTDVVTISVELSAQLYYVEDSGGTSARSALFYAQFCPTGTGAWQDMAFTGVGVYATHYWSLGIQSPGQGFWDNPIPSAYTQYAFGSTNYGDHTEGETQIVVPGSFQNPPVYARWTWRQHPYALGNPWRGFAPDPYLGSTANPGLTLSGSRTNPVHAVIPWSVPKGQYDVRVLKSTADITGSRESNRGAVTQILCYQADAADYSGQQRMALRIKATDQLNGQVSTLSATVSAACPVWGGSSWAVAQTSNPAWWFLWYARGKIVNGRRLYGCGLPDAQIDIETLKAWGAWCDSKGLAFNFVLDSRESQLDTLNRIARIGRATVTRKTGKLGVIWDAADLPITAMFGPFNIKAGTFEVTYLSDHLPDEIVVQFVDAAHDYAMSQVRVAVPGQTSALNPLQIDLEGCTDAVQAGKEANLLAAQQLWRRRSVVWETDFEGWTASRGDIVQISHDLTVWGYSGRVLERQGSTLVLSTDLPEGSGTLMLRAPDGTMTTVAVSATQLPVLAPVPEEIVETTFGFGGGGTTRFDLGDSDGTKVVPTRIDGVWQTDWQGRVALSNQPRTNLTSDANYTSGAPGKVGTVTTPFGATINVYQSDNSTWMYKSMVMAADAVYGQLYTSCFVAKWLGTGNGILIPENKHSNISSSFDFKTGEAWTSGQYHISMVPIGDGFYLCTQTTQETNQDLSVWNFALFFDAYDGPNPSTPNDRFAIGCACVVAGADLGLLLPENTTVTDYVNNLDGTLTLGQAPVQGAILEWSGAGQKITGYKQGVNLPAMGAFPLPGDLPDVPPLDWAWFMDPLATPGRRFKIVEVQPSEDGVRFAAVDDDADYYACETNPYAYTPPRDGLLLSGTLISAEYVEGWYNSLANSVDITLAWVLSTPRPVDVTVTVNGVVRPMQTVEGPSIQIPALRKGDSISTRIAVKSEMAAGNSQTYLYTVQGTSGAPSAVTGGASVIDGNRVKLSWAKNAEVDVVAYEVRATNTAWGTDGAIFRGNSLSCTVVPGAPGVPTTWYVRAVNAGGVYSLASLAISRTEAALPEVTGVDFSFFDTSETSATLTLKWVGATPAFGLKGYVVSYDAISTEVDATAVILPADWIGNRTFKIQVKDVLGNVSTGVPKLIDKLRPNPPTGLRAQVIDNNVLLYWTLPTKTTLPVSHVHIRSGDTWATAEEVGTKKGSFTALQELAGGAKTYWIRAVDTDGWESDEVSLGANVAEPPDFIFQGTLSSTLGGTFSGVRHAPGSLVFPVDTTQAWQTHFASRAWTGPSAQVAAGYPVYIQPTTSSGTYQEVFDFEQVFSSSQITVALDGTVVGGTPIVNVGIETSGDGTTWSALQAATTVFSVNFRFVRVTITITQSGDAAVYELKGMTCSLSTKLKTDAGSVDALASDAAGTLVNFALAYMDVQSITLTPAGTSPRSCVYDFQDTLITGTYTVASGVVTVNAADHELVVGQNVRLGYLNASPEILPVQSVVSAGQFTCATSLPDGSGGVIVYSEGMRVYLFDGAGARASGKISWVVKGV